VLILASTASFQPVPYISTYAATKAFDRFFALGWLRGGPLRVKVTGAMPGPPRASSSDVAHAGAFKRRGMQPAEEWRGWRLRPWRAAGDTHPNLER